MFDFVAQFPPDDRLTIVDVGAAWSGPGVDSFERLVRLGQARMIGFEPDPTELERLRQVYPAPHRFFPHIISDGEPATFHTTRASVASSLLPPNQPLLDLFQQLGEITSVIHREAVDTVRLDDALEGGDADLLKIDVQGAEGKVLAGAPRTLALAVAVEIEVEFVPLYEDQPLFADIDRDLRRHGFVFHRFLNYGAGSRVIKPIMVNSDVRALGSQALWADAVYIRDFMRLLEVPPAKLLRLAAILHDIYGSFDMCAHVLHHYDHSAGTALWPAYMRKLADG